MADDPIYIAKLETGEFDVDDIKLSGSTISTSGATNLTLAPGGGAVILPAAAPTLATQAVTKAYVDAALIDSIAIKEPARLAATVALPAYTAAAGPPKVLTATANGALTVDGFAVAVADRILVTQGGAAAGVDAGIYDVTATGSGAARWVLTRAADMLTGSQIAPGTITAVGQGGVNAGRSFLISTPAPIVVDVTPIVFAIETAFVIAAGANTQVQYNSGGVLAANANLAYNGAGVLSVNSVGPVAGTLALLDIVNATRIQLGAMTAQSVAGNSVALGAASTAADNGVAVGNAATASAAGAVAVGQSATASTGADAAALGHNAAATAAGALALGFGPTATGANAVAIGTAANAGATGTAVGNAAAATAASATAVGASSTASQAGAVAVGQSATASTGANAAALGRSAAATAAGALALGFGPTATGANAVAVGTTANAAVDGVAVGNAAAAADSATALGSLTVASTFGAVAVGNQAQATNVNAIAMGLGSIASSSSTVAIGGGSSSSANSGVAMGNGATSSAVSAIAIGSAATSAATNAIAIGAATANGARAIAIGSSAVANLADTWVVAGLPIARMGAGAVAGTVLQQLGAAPIVLGSVLIPTNTALGTAFPVTVLVGASFYVDSADSVCVTANGAAETVRFSVGDSGSATKYFALTSTVSTLTAFARTVNAGPLSTDPVVTNLIITTAAGFPATAGGNIRVVVRGYLLERE